MKARNFGFWVLSIIVGITAANIFGQTDKTDETERLRKRTETFLQTIRNEKWDELYKFVVVVRHQNGSVTRQRMDVVENADEDTKRQIAERFKKLYTAPKPGKIIRITIDKNNKTIALVEYEHEDLDGFDMILVDGEWYYTVDCYK